MEEDWDGPIAVLNVVAKRKIPAGLQEVKPQLTTS
jgi:hypothetical protein